MKRFVLLLVFILIAINTSNSQVWSPLGTGINNTVLGLGTYNNEVIAGGQFSNAGGVSVNNIAKWNGTSWSALGTGITGTVAFALTFTVFNNELIAGGMFTNAGGVNASNIAKWNGTTWSPLGSGTNNIVIALTVFNNELIAAGQFTTAGGTSANRIAKWNGTTWSVLGEGTDARINALAVYNNELIAGGQFLTAGGVICNYIAKWNGSTWASLGSGVNAFISSLAVYNNELIAAGSFTTAGGDSVKRIAKWNGTNWSSLGTGITGSESPAVLSLAVYPPQTGDLIAGGGFLTAGGVTVNNVAKWNGTNWSALESGTNNIVVSLTSNNSGLFAGGQFTMVGFTSANHIARWGVPSEIKNISSEIPSEYKLEQNYPNPFNSMTNFKFKMSNAGNAEIKVFDITGKEAAVLVNDYLKPGTYEVRFDAGKLPSGVYFYRMKAGKFAETKSIILIK